MVKFITWLIQWALPTVIIVNVIKLTLIEQVPNISHLHTLSKKDDWLLLSFGKCDQFWSGPELHINQCPLFSKDSLAFYRQQPNKDP